MLKRRTIAMLVAGCLIGAQAGIAANDEGSTALDTGYFEPKEQMVVEQVVVLEPVEHFVVMDLTPAEAEMLGAGNELVIVETMPIYVAAADTAYQPAYGERSVSLQVVPKSERAKATHSSFTTAFKGHPSSAPEIAGASTNGEQQYAPQQFAATHSWSYKSAGAFPMNAPELAGIEAQTLEKERLAQLSSSDRLAFSAPLTSGRTE